MSVVRIERTILCYEPSFFLSEFLFFVQTIIFLKIATEIVAAAVVNEMAAAAAQGLGFLISYFHFDPNPGSRFLTFFSYRDGEGV